MLRLMREKFKHLQWILWAVIISFVLWIFVAWGMGGTGDIGDVQDMSNVAIDVDGRQITRVDFVRSLQDVEGRYRSQLGEDAERFIEQLNLREQVRNSLVTREVALREAERSGLSVSDAEIRDYILRTFVDEKGQFLGRERLERSIRGRGYLEADFRRAIASDILLEKYRRAIEAGAVVTEPEVKEEYIRSNDRAKVDYALFDSKALGDAAAAGEAELRRFYDSNRSRFEREERKAKYVALDVVGFESKVTVTEADLERVFAEQARFGAFAERRRARHILLKTEGMEADPGRRAAVEKKAKDLLARAQAGESFEALAAQSSEDKGSATRGGDLGLFGRGAMVKPFEDAVFAMRPGEIQGPIESSFGFHIIRLDEVQAEKTLAEAKPELEKTVREQNARELATRTAGEVLKKHLADKDLVGIAAEVGHGVEETSFLREDAPSVALPGVDPLYVAKLTQTLFSIKDVQGIAESPVAAGSRILLVQLAEKRGPVVPPFEEVRATVEQEFRLERGKELAARKAAEVAAAVSGGTALDEAVKAAGAELRTSVDVTRIGTLPGVPGSEPAVAAAFALEPGRLSEPLAAGSGTVLVRTIERFEFDPAKFDAEKDTVRTRLEAEKRNALFDSVIGAVRRDLEDRKKIKYLAGDLFRQQQDEDDVL